MLTDSTLTGLGMGPGGVAFLGMAVLNMNLGQGPVLLLGRITNNLPATTTSRAARRRSTRLSPTGPTTSTVTLESHPPATGIYLNVAGEF